MTRTIIFVSHTGEISGAELVMLQLMRLAHEQGFTVMLACPEGPLRDRARASVDFETVTLPTVAQRRRGSGTRPGDSRSCKELANCRAHHCVSGSVGQLDRDSQLTVRIAGDQARPRTATCNVACPRHSLEHKTTNRRTDCKTRDPTSSRRLRTDIASCSFAGNSTSVSRLGVVVPPEVTEVRSPARRVVGIIGSLTPWKGHLVLMDAIARTVDVQLEIAGLPFPGDEMYAQVLRERAQQPDLAGRVTFLGYVDSLATIKGWDIAISASTSPEAGPLVALEAMSIGVPVVGTDLGGTSELLGDGAGSLVEPSDSVELAAEITRLLEDGSARSELSRIGRRKVEDRYDIQKNLPALLKELIDG